MRFSRTHALALGTRFDLATETPAPPAGVSVSTPETPSTEPAAPSAPAAPSSLAEHLAALRTDPTFRGDAPAAETLEATEPAAESTEAPSLEGFALDAENRLHRPDGTFASQAEIDAYNAAIPAEGAEGVDSSGLPDETGQDAPAPIIVALPPRREGEEPVEIEVTDPAVAERLNALRNDVMRRDEFNRRIEGVQQREAEFRQFETELAHDPVGSLLTRVPAPAQQQVAIALLHQHFDTLFPIAQTWANDRVAYREDALNLRETLTQGRQAADAAVAQLRASDAQRATEQQYLDAMEATVPATASRHDRAAYLAAADALIADALSSGQQITPDAVGQFLASHAARYFGTTPSSAPAATHPSTPAPTPTAPAAAAPQGHSAAPAAPTRARATAVRLKATQQVRAAAAAIAPVGAGAPPVGTERPPVHATVRERLQWLRTR